MIVCGHEVELATSCPSFLWNLTNIYVTGLQYAFIGFFMSNKLDIGFMHVVLHMDVMERSPFLLICVSFLSSVTSDTYLRDWSHWFMVSCF